MERCCLSEEDTKWNETTQLSSILPGIRSQFLALVAIRYKYSITACVLFSREFDRIVWSAAVSHPCRGRVVKPCGAA